MSRVVLLTGASGLVGREVAAAFARAGWRVLALAHRRRPRIPGVEWVRALGGQVERLPLADALVHMAAAIPSVVGEGAFAAYRRANMELSERLFGAAVARGCRAVVFLSTLQFLARPLARRITEEHPAAPATFYGMSKRWAELALLEITRGSPTRPVILRIPSPVPSTAEGLQLTVLRRWITEATERRTVTVWGSGSRTQDFLSASDIGAAALAALRSPRAHGVYHLGSGAPLSMRALAKLVAGRLGARVVFEGSDRLENERWNISIEKAARDFGYSPKLDSARAVTRLLDSLPCNS
jgi:nucleoside-diphosphate-sugar epimerase